MCVGALQVAALLGMQHGADPADDIIGPGQRHFFQKGELVIHQPAAVEHQNRTAIVRQ